MIRKKVIMKDRNEKNRKKIEGKKKRETEREREREREKGKRKKKIVFFFFSVLLVPRRVSKCDRFQFSRPYATTFRLRGGSVHA